MSNVQRFHQDDDAYERWLEEHDGFVLNSYPSPSPSYLKLHSSRCSHIDITRGRAGRRWTYDYIKVCSDDLDSLQKWAQGETGVAADLCPTCDPAGRSSRQ
jgi:hypothetical protein